MAIANPTIEDIREIVKETWGYDSFRVGQEETITPVLEGRDALAVLPTGAGKSLIFQSLAIVLPGTMIVVSPLIALMVDQVKNANERGIKATYINSALTDTEMATRLAGFIQGKYKLLYVAPERLNLPRFQQACSQVVISVVAVDECHCVSRMLDYRPAYGYVDDFIAHLRKKRDVRVVAVTATATLEMEQDIAAGCLLSPGYARIWRSPIRPEVQMSVVSNFSSPWTAILNVIKAMDLSARHIVYTTSRAGAEKLREMTAQSTNISPNLVAHYHAGLEPVMRAQVQKDFTDGKIRIIFSTCAFGMGVDIPDIRTVVHFGIPASVEDYTQEIGRAGRDGVTSRAILVCSGPDDYSVGIRRTLITCNHPAWVTYEAVWKYLHDKMEPNTILARSGESIAKDMADNGYLGDAVQTEANQRGMGGSILQVLSNMEAKGLVSRSMLGAWVQVRRLENMATADIDNVQQMRVIEWLKEQEDDSFGFDRTEAARKLAVSELIFERTIRLLVEKNCLEVDKPYKGKATRILLYGATLADVMSQAEIEARHAQAMERLEIMLRYMKAPALFGVNGDPAYRAFIESYFMGGML